MTDKAERQIIHDKFVVFATAHVSCHRRCGDSFGEFYRLALEALSNTYGVNDEDARNWSTEVAESFS